MQPDIRRVFQELLVEIRNLDAAYGGDECGIRALLVGHRFKAAEEAIRGPEFVDDINRCAVCGWQLAGDIQSGCVRGNCSFRPLPEKFYSPDRAAREGATHRSPIPQADGDCGSIFTMAEISGEGGGL